MNNLSSLYRRKRKGHGISLLMPFKSDCKYRTDTYNWLTKYWAHELPGAELITGTDDHVPFSKTSAFNNARSQATGDILALIDADCYITPEVILSCAEAMRDHRENGRRLWYIPYRRFYRLNQVATNHLLTTDPANPLKFTSPPDTRDIDNTHEHSSQGHWWGAMIQLMPAEAYDMVGGCDPRFHGWGGEDVAFMRAIDTLYGKHKTTPNQVLHMWHPVIEAKYKLRNWPGQLSSTANTELANRYYGAFGDPRRMRRLVNEYQDDKIPQGEVEARE